MKHRTYTKQHQRLGQHFLISREPLAEIIAAAKKEKPVETVIEIGPGKGVLTRALAAVFPSIIAIEKDERLAAELQKEKIPNTKIITGDIRDIPLSPLNHHHPYAVIANIPYYLTGQLIRMFLESNEPPAYMILMVQKEVAERIAASPPHMSILTVSAQAYGEVRIIAEVPRTAFAPAPKVDSTVILIRNINKTFFEKYKVAEKDFFTVVRAGFSAKRKTLLNALTSGLSLQKETIATALRSTGIKETARAESLIKKQWALLTTAIFRP